METHNLTRRTVLHGLGTSMALPLLESLLPKAAWGAEKSAAPLRLAYLYVPNGMNMEHWTPSDEGTEFKLPSILEPLENMRKHVSVLTGLAQQKAAANGDGGGDHARALATFLTGTQARKTSGADIRAGISADQLAAQQVGRLTRFASLEVGCEPGGLAGSCDSGYSCAYSHSIAWRTESTPVAKEVNPKLVFERLFTNGKLNESSEAREKREKYRKSILDFVRQDAQSLQSKLSQADRRKLDEYFSAVREMEERLARVDKIPETNGAQAPSGIPAKFEDHLRLMADMLVLAFRTDSTRVATFVLADEGSNRTYKNLGVTDGHHELSHHNRKPEKLESIRKINRFHVETLAYFLERMQEVREGERSLLDQSMIVYGSGIGDGDRHNHDDLPILLCGGGGGSLTPGRHVRYEKGTPMTNLHLSLLERLGCKAEHLGDSSGKLERLKA